MGVGEGIWVRAFGVRAWVEGVARRVPCGIVVFKIAREHKGHSLCSPAMRLTMNL